MAVRKNRKQEYIIVKCKNIKNTIYLSLLKNMKNNIFIGIISYLPADLEIREIRKNGIIKQLNWIIKQLNSDIPITIIAQGYKDEDITMCNNMNRKIEYIRYDMGIGPAIARNSLLKKLYESDYDFMLIMDDDVILDDYYDGVDLINMVNDNPGILKNIDVIAGHNPTFSGFKKQKFYDQENTINYFNFRKHSLGSQICLIRNINKYYNKQIFQVNMFNENGENDGHEDLIFIKELILNGIKYVVCTDWIYKFLNPSKSSTVFKNKNDKGSSEKSHMYANLNTYKYMNKNFHTKYNIDLIENLLNVEYGTQEYKDNYKIILKNVISAGSKWNKEYNALSKIKANDLKIQRLKKHIFTEKELNITTRQK